MHLYNQIFLPTNYTLQVNNSNINILLISNFTQDLNKINNYNIS